MEDEFPRRKADVRLDESRIEAHPPRGRIDVRPGVQQALGGAALPAVARLPEPVVDVICRRPVLAAQCSGVSPGRPVVRASISAPAASRIVAIRGPPGK